MSRITAVRSIAVRPRIFSRLRCWAGVSSSSKTTVSASTALAELVQLLGLAAPDVGRRVGRVAVSGRPAPPRRRPRCRRAAQLVEARLDLVQRARPGDHADEHDPLPEAPLDQASGRSDRRGVAVRPTSIERRRVELDAWPRAAPDRRGSADGSRERAGELDLELAAGIVHRRRGRRRARRRERRGGRAAPAAAGQGDARHRAPRRRARPPGAGSSPTSSTFTPPADAAARARDRVGRRGPTPLDGRAPTSTRCGLPTSTDHDGQPSSGAPASPAVAAGPERARAKTSAGPSRPDAPRARGPAPASSTARGPAPVSITASARARDEPGVEERRAPQQRSPLPLVSAGAPSALRSSIASVPAGGARQATSTPSAPTPRCRSQSAAPARRARRAPPRRRPRRRAREEVVAEPVVLAAQSHPHGHSAARHQSRPTASSRSGRSASSQTTRGSRPNHDSWRRAKARVRRRGLGAGLGELDAPLEVLEQLPVAEGLAGGPRQPAGAPASARTSSAKPRQSCASRRASSRAVEDGAGRGADRRGGPGRAHRPAGPARRTRRVGRSEGHLEGAQDPPAVARLDPGRRGRIQRLEPSRSGRRARRARRPRRSSSREHGRVAARQLEAVEDGPVVEPGPSDEHRHRAPALDARHGRRGGTPELGDARTPRTGRRGRGGAKAPGALLVESASPCRGPSRGTPPSRRPRRARPGGGPSGELDGERRLARRGRADDGEVARLGVDRRPPRQSPAPAPAPAGRAVPWRGLERWTRRSFSRVIRCSALSIASSSAAGGFGRGPVRARTGPARRR